MDFPGYHDFRMLYSGRSMVVFRARTASNGRVVIKCARETQQGAAHIQALRREFEILTALDGVQLVVRPVELISHQHRFALVLHDTAKTALDELCSQRRLNYGEKLRIALQLAEALGNVHQRGVIHRDINPTNMVVDDQTLELELIDFGISTRLSGTPSMTLMAQGMTGTPHYISPEQTGRTSRNVDYRTDLYSLGATLFELFAERRPFVGDDISGLLHAHLARPAPELSSVWAEAPPVLSRMIARLLSKAPEERYQSAAGLAADLARLQSEGPHSDFELGSLDYPEHFRIASGLYGRELEVQQLRRAVTNVSESLGARLLLIAGYSGIGKSALVAGIMDTVESTGCRFAAGKFDQFERDALYGPFAEALSELGRQVVSHIDEGPSATRERLLGELGPVADVLVQAVPGLAALLGEQSSPDALSATELHNRLMLAFRRFVDALTRERPLVLFIDDLQWGDAASLGMLFALAGRVEPGLLIIGAYRSNEVDATHALMQQLSELQASGKTVEQMSLGPLGVADLNAMLADTLAAPQPRTLELAELIHETTAGNPFFARQLLENLHDRGLLTYDMPTRAWTWSLDAIRSSGVYPDVIDLMTNRIERLPPAARTAMAHGAALGASFELDALASVMEISDTEAAEAVWPALAGQFLIPVASSSVAEEPDLSRPPEVSRTLRFLHDRVQQAAYQQVDSDELPALHHKIGRLLSDRLGEPLPERELLTVVSHLNKGSALVDDPEDKQRLASLNLRAARKAKNAGAWHLAREHAQTGHDLLAPEAQRSSQLGRDLTFELAEATYLVGEHDSADQLFESLVSRVESDIESARVDVARIALYESAGLYDKNIAVGCAALARLGVHIDLDPKVAASGIEDERARLLGRIDGLDIASIVDAAALTNERELAVQRLLMNMAAPAYFYSAEHFILVVLKAANHTLDFGNSPLSAFAFAWLGTVLGAVWGDYKTANAFGELALSLNQKLPFPAIECKIRLLYGLFIKHWRRPVEQSIPELRAALAIGNETGDLAYAGYAACILTRTLLSAGRPLQEVLDSITETRAFLQGIRNESLIEHQRLMEATVLALVSPEGDPQTLSRHDFDEQRSLETFQRTRFGVGIALTYAYRLQTALVHGAYERAFDIYQELAEPLIYVAGMHHIPEVHIWGAYAAARLAESAEGERRNELESVLDSTLRQMAVWAESCPENTQHRLDLLRAEKALLSGDQSGAISTYGIAINGARERGFVVDELLGHQALASLFQRMGSEVAARAHLEEAALALRSWGAVGLAEPLEHGRINARDSIPQSTRGGSLVTTEQVRLDLTPFVKASRAIAAELELEQLLRKLMTTVVETAGAESGHLLLSHEQTLWLEARRESGGSTEVMQHRPLEEMRDELPVTLISHAIETAQPIVLADATEDQDFGNDPYVLSHRPLSVMAMPLIDQKRLVGVVYLENNLSSRMFTPNRAEILSLLSSQLAIAIDKARLYTQLEERVRERTKQLSDTLEELKEAQAQLVMREKMASLGDLVAGIAHELNTPLGAVYGNHQTAATLVNRIREQLGNEHTPAKDTANKLSSLLTTTGQALKQVRHVVSSLRQFARLDLAERDRVDVHEGIEAALALSRHQFGKQVEVIRDYGQVPPLSCYPSRLNQVFMNLLVNAAQAIQGKGTVLIRTRVEGRSAVVEIDDDGTGIQPEDLARVFDPGFTTKGRRIGTGLGLSIVHRIVSEHGGTIGVESTVGEGTRFRMHLPLDATN